MVQGAVTKIDLPSRTVTAKISHNGPHPEETQITADHLVIALGSVTNYHHTPGVAEHSLGVKRLEDASAICKQVLSCLERAKTESDESRRKALLTFVVAGGGFTGVETMAAITSLVREQVDRTNIAAKGELRTILVNPGDRLLGEISPELAVYATHKLQQRSVEIRMRTSITGASASTVDVKPGEQIAANTLIWAAGVMPNPIVSQLNCEKGKHGGIKVNGCCQVAEHEGVWAIGIVLRFQILRVNREPTRPLRRMPPERERLLHATLSVRSGVFHRAPSPSSRLVNSHWWGSIRVLLVY